MLRMRRKCLSENGGCCGIERNLVPQRQRPKRLSILKRGRRGNVIQEPHNCWNCGSEPSAGLQRLLSWREPETQEWGCAAQSLLRRQCDKISTEASEKTSKYQLTHCGTRKTSGWPTSTDFSQRRRIHSTCTT